MGREDGRASKIRKRDEKRREGEGAEALDAAAMSLEELNAELEKVRKEAEHQETLARDNEAKIARFEELDRAEEESAVVVRRRLAAASYQHGIMEGKIRSSDLYFGFIYADTQMSYKKKVMTMKKSCSLMGEIAELKKD